MSKRKRFLIAFIISMVPLFAVLSLKGPDIDGVWVEGALGNGLACQGLQAMVISGDRIEFFMLSESVKIFEITDTKVKDNGTVIRHTDEGGFEFSISNDAMKLVSAPRVYNHDITSGLPTLLTRC